jgi:enoyl-CoA hydratase/carnithine racemase
MIMSGDMIDATEAERLGLVLKVVPPEKLMPAALELGQRLAKGAPIALSMIKRAVYKAQHSTLEETVEFESLGAARIRFTEDVREGVQAFFERREPRFQGK